MLYFKINASLNKLQESIKIFQKLLDEIDDFNLRANQYLNKYDLDDEKLIKSNKEAINLNGKAVLEIENITGIVLGDRLMSFEANKDKLDRSILGEIKLKKVNQMDSFILSQYK